MATLPFDAVADGSVTVVLPNVAAVGWICIYHSDQSRGPIITIAGFTTNIPVVAGDRVVQRLAIPWLTTRMVITATVP